MIGRLYLLGAAGGSAIIRVVGRQGKAMMIEELGGCGFPYRAWPEDLTHELTPAEAAGLLADRAKCTA